MTRCEKVVDCVLAVGESGLSQRQGRMAEGSIGGNFPESRSVMEVAACPSRLTHARPYDSHGQDCSVWSICCTQSTTDGSFSASQNQH